MTETLESASLDTDENGHTLFLETDEGRRAIRVGFEEGRELLAALEPIRDWIAEGDRERAAYERATPEEREAVRAGRDPIAAVDEYIEREREAADTLRKRIREDGC